MSDDVPAHPEVPESYTLDDFYNINNQLGTRMRYTAASIRKGEAGEPVSFRPNAFHTRRIDEILAARIDPELRTRSDILHDALHLWLQTWDEQYPDGANGMMRTQFQMDELEREASVQKNFALRSQMILDDLRETGDVRKLTRYITMVSDGIEEFGDTASPGIVTKLRAMLDTAERLREAARGRVDG